MRDVTVLYDERCALCTRLSRRLARAEGITIASIGSERGDRLLHDLPPDERYASLHVVDAAGRRRSGADGLPLALRTVRGGRLLGRLIELFPGAASLAYGAVARNRIRLSRPGVSRRS